MTSDIFEEGENGFIALSFQFFAFVSLQDDNYEIYIMNMDGRNQTNLTNSDYWEVYPVFQP